MNEQVGELLKHVNSKAEKKHFELVDTSIAVLYCNGFINRATRDKCHQKLVKEIIGTQKDSTHD
jgi:hypothetical protein